MSRLLYFDCFSGVSGDMVLGALLDAGLPLEELRRALGRLAIAGLDVGAAASTAPGYAATKFTVRDRSRTRVGSSAARIDHIRHHEHFISTIMDHDHPHEHASSPGSSSASQPGGDLRLIDVRAVPVGSSDRAKMLFERLAEAEAAIHQMPVDKVHLHEVGALDSIIDIVGAVFALEWFGADQIVCSPLNVGGGTVQSRARPLSGAGAGHPALLAARPYLQRASGRSW